MAKARKELPKPPETAANEPPPEAIAAAQNMQPVQMPEWYASGAQLVWAGNDVQLIFNKPVLLGDVAHGQALVSQTIALILPVGSVRMSSATIKDVSILLAEQVAKREAEFGPIETDFTRQKEREKASKKKH